MDEEYDSAAWLCTKHPSPSPDPVPVLVVDCGGAIPWLPVAVSLWNEALLNVLLFFPASLLPPIEAHFSYVYPLHVGGCSALP